MKTTPLLLAAAILIALIACAAAAAADEAPPPQDDPAALMCLPADTDDPEADTCGDPAFDLDRDPAPMSVQAALSCTTCWSFCHGYGACFNCCCFGQC